MGELDAGHRAAVERYEERKRRQPDVRQAWWEERRAIEDYNRRQDVPGGRKIMLALAIIVALVILVFYVHGLWPGLMAVFWGVVALVITGYVVDKKSPPPKPFPRYPEEPEEPTPPSLVEAISTTRRPYFALQELMREQHRQSLVIGTTNGQDLLLTGRERHLLVLGPARTSYKTSGPTISSILSATGPVVSTSVKDDAYRATAHARSNLGTLWHMQLDRDTPLLPGCKPLRWSPITAAIDWDTARRIGRAMCMAASSEGVVDGTYWKAQAGNVLAYLLHAAALGRRDVTWLRMVLSENERKLREALNIFDTHQRPLHRSELEQLIKLDPRHRNSIWQTMQNAMQGYRSDAALKTTKDPNFVAQDFVAGNLHGQLGQFDTVYITASQEVQEDVAPLIVGLLREIETLTYRQYKRDSSTGIYNRPPVLFSLDELANLAPLPKLTTTLSQGGSQGLLVVAALQDMTQAHAQWGKAGEGFISQFQDVLVFPGIRHKETLETIASLGGMEWVEKVSTSYSRTEGRSGGTSRTRSYTSLPTTTTSTGWSTSETWGQSTSHHHVAVLTSGDVYQGGRSEPLHPHRVLLLSDGGWRFVRALPYFQTLPFHHVVTRSWQNIVEECDDDDARLDILPPEFERFHYVGFEVYGEQAEMVTRWAKDYMEKHARRRGWRRDRIIEGSSAPAVE